MTSRARGKSRKNDIFCLTTLCIRGKIKVAKYVKPLDEDEKGESAVKYRLPFALCKERGIKLPDWATPRDAWDALKGFGISPDSEYKKMYKKMYNKVYQRERRKEKKARKEQACDAQHSPNYDYEIQEGKIAGIKKGEPMSFEQADGGAPNPHFSSSVEFGGNLYGYTTNCQTCVVVFEARQRGYDVRTLPNNRNPYIKDLSYWTNLAYIDENGNHPQYIVPNKRENKTKFLDRVIEDGRYTLQFVKGGNGHIVSIQRINGVLTIYDPQSGRKIANIGEYLRERKNLKILRVDNVEFDPQYVNYIMKGTK